MTTDGLRDRGRALEDAFFASESEKKLEAMRAAMAAKEAAAVIAQQTGIDDASVIERIVELGVRPETLAAFALVPLVHVAWADGTIDPKEREAVLIEAKALGIHDGPGLDLLAGWLERRPGPELFSTWKAWHADVIGGLDADARLALGAAILENARRVARAAGGMFGIASVNHEEHAALQQLTEVLAPA